MTYQDFINDILSKRERFQKDNSSIKYERHHIIPVGIGGPDTEDNLIDLTLQEHFIAHKLLAEENPNNTTLVYPYYYMTHAKGGKIIHTPEEYEESKLLWLNSDNNTSWKKGNKSWNTGLTKETDKRVKRVGELNRIHMTGYKYSQETKDKHKEDMLNIWKERKDNGYEGLTEEQKQVVSEKTKEAMWTPEVRERYNKSVKEQKLKNSKRKLHWFTNGKKRVFCETCPEGFRPGNDINGKKPGGRPKRIKEELKTMINMKVYRDIEDVKLPTKANSSDAGFDLYSPIDFKFTKDGPDYITINTHIHFDIPDGYVGFLKSKSGLNVYKHIASDGVIDAGYTGSVVVKLTRNSKLIDKEVEFKKGDKITQIVFLPVPKITLEEVDSLDKFDSKDSSRGNNGFGSSGR